MKIILEQYVGKYHKDAYLTLKSIQICCETFFTEINAGNYKIRYDLVSPDIVNTNASKSEQLIKFCPYCGEKTVFEKRKVDEDGKIVEEN